MDIGIRHGVLGLGFLLLAGPVAAQQAADSLPEGVTPAMVTNGRSLFAGEGLCVACHGADAKGTIGPNLTDRAWLNGTGTFAEIVARIQSGVTPADSKTGQIMPPKGGSALTDEQVKAVAAYVWTLSRRPAKKG